VEIREICVKKWGSPLPLQECIHLGGEDEDGFVQTVDLVGPDGEAILSPNVPANFLLARP